MLNIHINQFSISKIFIGFFFRICLAVISTTVQCGIKIQILKDDIKKETVAFLCNKQPNNTHNFSVICSVVFRADMDC